MNNIRRKQIQRIWDAVSAVQSDLEDIQNDEQEAYDNLPESLQYSERGEAMENAISELEDAISSLEELLEHLETAAE